MSRKISLGAALALALLLVASSIPLTMLYAQSMQNRIITNLPQRIQEFQALEEIRGIIDQNYYDAVDTDSISTATVQGYISGLGDQESRYLSPEEYRTYQDRLEGRRPETGLELNYVPPPAAAPGKPDEPAAAVDNGSIVVASVKDGSPAAVSGLQTGDVILKAESAEEVIYDAKKLRTANARELLNTLLNFELKSAKTPTVSITFTFKRGDIQLPPANVMFGNSVSSISSELMKAPVKGGSQNVGYIKIFYFMKNTADDLEAAVKELSRNGASSFVFDLRGCSEGSAEYACKALDLFLPILGGNDMLATIQYKNDHKAPRTFPSSAATDASYVVGSLAILVNSATSGAAELFAYDMCAFNNHSESSPVILVGTETAGMHDEQEAFPLRQVGGAALLTVGKVLPYRSGADWNLTLTQRVGNEELILSTAIALLTRTPQADDDVPA